MDARRSRPGIPPKKREPQAVKEGGSPNKSTPSPKQQFQMAKGSRTSGKPASKNFPTPKQLLKFQTRKQTPKGQGTPDKKQQQRSGKKVTTPHPVKEEPQEEDDEEETGEEYEDHESDDGEVQVAKGAKKRQQRQQKKLKMKKVRRHPGTQPSGRGTYKCKYCDAMLCSEQGLKIHIKFRHKREKNYRCSFEWCKYKAGKKATFENHLIRIHKFVKNGISEDGLYRWPQIPPLTQMAPGVRIPLVPVDRTRSGNQASTSGPTSGAQLTARQRRWAKNVSDTLLANREFFDNAYFLLKNDPGLPSEEDE